MSWLWRDDTSPASFEKALSKLSSQISSANSSLETTRSRARRAKALWTLYSTLAYVVYTLILTLILGPQKWSWPHYAGLIGAPVIIYAVRKASTLFFDWRISNQQAKVDNLQQQRESKIAELKKATKYDSTQELLQKYGAGPKQTPSKQPQQGTKRKINPLPQPPRTGIPPPPTANIPGRTSPQPPKVPQIGHEIAPSSPPRQPLLSSATLSPISPGEPGFAPNAFSVPSPSSHYVQESHWYDRILDVLLGEDETLAKNRLALICSNCRLVNGQAPPGFKTLEEVGKWRCSSCGSWNGVESEAAKVVKDMARQADIDAGLENTGKELDKEQSASPIQALVSDHDSDPEDGQRKIPEEVQEGSVAEEASVDGGISDSKRMTRSSSRQLQNG